MYIFLCLVKISLLIVYLFVAYWITYSVGQKYICSKVAQLNLLVFGLFNSELKQLVSYKNKIKQIRNYIFHKFSSVRPKDILNLYLKEEVNKTRVIPMLPQEIYRDHEGLVCTVYCTINLELDWHLSIVICMFNNKFYNICCDKTMSFASAFMQ